MYSIVDDRGIVLESAIDDLFEAERLLCILINNGYNAYLVDEDT